jgi:tetratricopeptide (TPR) repeat protein
MKCGRSPVGVFCIFAGCCAVGVVLGVPDALLANGPAPSSSISQDPLSLEDEPEVLKPERSRSPAAQDHLDAVSLFAAGRMHEQRDELAEALRCYERALRCDPESNSILRAIVPTAVRLKRYAEAVRYAMKVGESDSTDSLMLRRLGFYLTDEGDYPRALQLYQKALAGRSHGKEAVGDILLRMEMGRICHLLEQYPLAAENFAKVQYALDHPDEFAIDEQLKRVLLAEPGPTYAMMGESFLHANRPDEAMAAFKKSDALAPNSAILQFNLAQVYAKTGKPAEALTALEASFPEHLKGEGALPYETLADVLKQLGKSEELIPRLEKLRADDATNVALTNFLASQYREAGKFDKAETLYQEWVHRVATKIGFRNLIDLQLQTKRSDALLVTLGQAIDELGVMEALGAVPPSLSDDADLVKILIDAAHAVYKKNPEELTSGMRQAVALLALETKQYDVASEFFGLAFAEKPKEPAELLLAWGVGLLMDDHAAEAVKVFQRGIDEKLLPSDNPTFYFYLSGALAMCKQTDEALAAAHKAAELNRNSARFAERAAWVLYIAKKNADSQKAYEELIRDYDGNASPEDRAVLRAARLALSNLCVLEERFPEAEEWLEQVLDEFPDDVNAMNDLGYLWADQNKKLSRAHRMIQKAVEAEPDNIAYRDSLGWVLFREGRYADALVELEKAAAGEKADGAVLDHLGDAYQKANQLDKAVDAWRRAAKAFREEKDLDKAEAIEKKIPQ